MSKDDIRELNEKFGGTYKISSKGSPKRLHSYHTPTVYLGAGIGCYFVGFGVLAKGYNKLWLVGGFVPLITMMLYNNKSQPE